MSAALCKEGMEPYEELAASTNAGSSFFYDCIQLPDAA